MVMDTLCSCHLSNLLSFIMKQMLPVLCMLALVNITSFAILSDAGGGGTLDRVVVNNWPDVYVRMRVKNGDVNALAIMTNNDILQTKYVAGIDQFGIDINSLSIGDSVHIIINDVMKNMGTKYKDATMNDKTTITIGSDSNSYLCGAWTSTIEPNNVTVELDCNVVSKNKDIVTAKCGTDLWPNSVFNRIPIYVYAGSMTRFGYGIDTNYAIFGSNYFQTSGSVPSDWNESIQYDVDGSGTSLIIGNQVTIMGLPKSFVSYWVNTIHAKAYMGNRYAMLVPPGSS